MEQLRTEVLLDDLAFPEGPRWHDGALWFSDMHLAQVFTVGLDGASEVVVDVPARPSGLGWQPDGTLLIVSMLDHKVLRFADGTLGEHADLSPIATGHCNDMVVDSEGRAYVGNFGFDMYAGQPPAASQLAFVDSDGTTSVAAERLNFPNGSMITPDGTTLIVGESLGARLLAFDIADDGSLSNRRTWADVPGEIPDGACLDTEGAVWLASPATGEVVRVFEHGRITHRVKSSDGRSAYACMLGGDDGTTLFVCTSSAMLPDDTLAQRGGAIETVHVDVPHAGLP